jgi:hypothetical protein
LAKRSGLAGLRGCAVSDSGVRGSAAKLRRTVDDPVRPLPKWVFRSRSARLLSDLPA